MNLFLVRLPPRLGMLLGVVAASMPLISQPSPPVVRLIGVYSNLYSHKTPGPDDPPGIEDPSRPILGLELYKEGNRVFGALTVAENVGDLAAPLEDIEYDPASGHLAFASWVFPDIWNGSDEPVSYATYGTYVQAEGVLSDRGLLLRIMKRNLPGRGKPTKGTTGWILDWGGWRPDWESIAPEWIPRVEAQKKVPQSYLAWRLTFPRPAMDFDRSASQPEPELLGPPNHWPPAAPVASPSKPPPAREPAPTPKSLGRFSALRYIEEAGDVLGEDVTLYQEGDHVFGTYTDAEGEPRSAPLEQLKFDPTTGRIYFEAWTFGGVTDASGYPGRQIPCWNLTLASGSIRGDGLHLRERHYSFDQARGAGAVAVDWNLDHLPPEEAFLPLVKDGDHAPSSYLEWRRDAGYPWFRKPLPEPGPPEAGGALASGSERPPARPAVVPSRALSPFWTAWINRIHRTSVRLRGIAVLFAVVFFAIGLVKFGRSLWQLDPLGAVLSAGLILAALAFTFSFFPLIILGAALAAPLVFRRDRIRLPR